MHSSHSWEVESVTEWGIAGRCSSIVYRVLTRMMMVELACIAREIIVAVARQACPTKSGKRCLILVQFMLSMSCKWHSVGTWAGSAQRADKVKFATDC